MPDDQGLKIIIWEGIVCWQSLNNAARYEVELAITYRGCDEVDRPIEERVSRSYTLQAPANWLEVPVASDTVRFFRTDVTASVSARDAQGALIESNQVTAADFLPRCG